MPTSPTPSIPTFSTGDLLTQTSMAGITSNLTNLYNYVMGGFRTLKPITAVRVTSTVSLPNNTQTVIPFDLADINNDNGWVATGADHITINTAGIYRCVGYGGHTAAFNTIAVYICVNGTNPSTNAIGTFSATGNIGVAEGVAQLAVGATVYMVILQATGSAQNVATTFGGTRLSVEWLSP